MTGHVLELVIGGLAVAVTLAGGLLAAALDRPARRRRGR